MLKPVYRTASFVCQLVARLPIGTSLGIAHLLWTILSGGLLASRGALFPALDAAGLCATEVRQSEAALRDGKWSVQRLLVRLEWMIKSERHAKAVQMGGGWRPLLLDWVGFFRPQLRGCVSKHYASESGKALPAIEFGMIASVQQMSVAGSSAHATRQIPQLRALNRTGDTTALVRLAGEHQERWDVVVADRQVKVSHIEEAGVYHFVIRASQNTSARQREPPPPEPGKRGRRATRGSLVRPTDRHYKGKLLSATPCDREECFTHQGRTLRAKWFEKLLVSGSTRVVHCLVVADPRYKQPWVLLTDLEGESAETIYLLPPV